jgi:hypothetical protein
MRAKNQRALDSPRLSEDSPRFSELVQRLTGRGRPTAKEIARRNAAETAEKIRRIFAGSSGTKSIQTDK